MIFIVLVLFWTRSLWVHHGSLLWFGYLVVFMLHYTQYFMECELVSLL